MDKPLLYTSDHSRIHGLGVSSASSFSEYIKIMIRSILSVMQIYFDFKYTYGTTGKSLFIPLGEKF